MHARVDPATHSNSSLNYSESRLCENNIMAKRAGIVQVVHVPVLCRFLLTFFSSDLVFLVMQFIRLIFQTHTQHRTRTKDHTQTQHRPLTEHRTQAEHHTQTQHRTQQSAKRTEWSLLFLTFANHLRVYVCMCTCVYVCMCVCVCLSYEYIYIYINMSIYINKQVIYI